MEYCYDLILIKINIVVKEPNIMTNEGLCISAKENKKKTLSVKQPLCQFEHSNLVYKVHLNAPLSSYQSHQALPNKEIKIAEFTRCT